MCKARGSHVPSDMVQHTQRTASQKIFLEKLMRAAGGISYPLEPVVQRQSATDTSSGPKVARFYRDPSISVWIFYVCEVATLEEGSFDQRRVLLRWMFATSPK